MSMLSKDQIKQMIQYYDIKTTDDIKDAFKDMFGEAIQEIMEAELDTHLGYDKNSKETKDTDNRRNGTSNKTLRSSEFGEIPLTIPRDRNSEYEPIIVKKNQTSLSGLEDQIIAMYTKGLSTREIQDYFTDLYGAEVSPTLISNVTNKILPLVKEWQNRPLDALYPIIFMDAIHFKVRHEGRIQSKAAYVVLGVTIEGFKEVLGIWIGESESSKFWLMVLNELKNRGVQDILIACTDNLNGFSEAIQATFPQTEVQKCIVHQIRNSIRFVGYKDLKALTADLKPIYKASTEELALEALSEFDEKWGKKYPIITKSWMDNWSELATFFKYPAELRRIIYTTNVIEGFHRQLRKPTKSKSVFPSDESLLKMLYLVTMDVTKKWTMKVQNWGQILSQFVIFFEDRVTDYI
ncbi:IS256 family transposase [Enterococcus faecalis]|uniref:IS256 family transposase n=1 Tax=Enterococcus faecalis TaxID=1351 RepID=UPI0029C929E6|nr:IS256 family transposase [Enterococcus faecalis]WPH45595.1 IS256 family transposase [Enterococcus faecalis]